MDSRSSSSLGTSHERLPSPRNSPAILESARRDLEKLLGSEHVRSAAPADFINGAASHLVVEPDSAEKVAATLRIAFDAGLHVVPRGGGTKKNWGNPAHAAEIILSLRRLNRIVEHAWGDMTATVEAGCTLAQLQQTLAQHGQRLALDPLWPDRATIGAILATNDSGPLRLRFGSLRDLVIGITLALPDGSLAKSGGKVVKNVAGYDLPKLAIGSLGTLGAITQVTFRLHPVPRESRTLSFALENFVEMNRFLLAIHDCSAVPTGLQVRAASTQPVEVDIRFEGTITGCDVQIEQVVSIAHAQGAMPIESTGAAWDSGTDLWIASTFSTISKFTLLPSEIAGFLYSLTEVSRTRRLSWSVVVQSVGIGCLRLESADPEEHLTGLQTLRSQLESGGGSLAILHCPAEMKLEIDAWGSAGDTLPLMRSIKHQFDPAGVLNPGRFLDGI
jgi:glycolate oxidase FAD binding subunit